LAVLYSSDDFKRRLQEVCGYFQEICIVICQEYSRMAQIDLLR